MNEVPTLKEELDRKVLNAIQRLESERRTGRATEAQVKYAIDILWEAFAGIADHDFNIMCEIMAGDIRPDGSFYTREFLFNKKHQILAQITNLHDGRVIARVGDHQRVYDFREGRNPCSEAKEKFQDVTDKLMSVGYEQL